MSFSLAIGIKKIRNTKSVQCFADFFIKVVDGFLPSIKYMQLREQNDPKKSIAITAGLEWPRKVAPPPPPSKIHEN
jgi:hypothetical protein